uniref:Protein TFG n=1 Tax=Phallusia mammillata TaxID=59560 RepID=A0A6F9DUR6_9ASCI|nr:protein TFG [Phallusia mammillata]
MLNTTSMVNQSQGSGSTDLTGKLIIKARLGDDIRRIPIYNEELTYDELILMMQRVFRGTLETNEEVTIKYADEDGDLITIFDDSDMNLAIQMSRILKITIFTKAHPQSGNKQQLGGTTGIRNELMQIRNQVNKLLDQLAVETPDGISPESTVPTVSVVKPNIKTQEEVHTEATPSLAPSQATYEPAFDPLTAGLNNSTQQVTNFGKTADRPASPVESVNSVSSATQLRQQQPPQQQPQQPATQTSMDSLHQSFGMMPQQNQNQAFPPQTQNPEQMQTTYQQGAQPPMPAASTQVVPPAQTQNQPSNYAGTTQYGQQPVQHTNPPMTSQQYTAPNMQAPGMNSAPQANYGPPGSSYNPYDQQQVQDQRQQPSPKVANQYGGSPQAPQPTPYGQPANPMPQQNQQGFHQQPRGPPATQPGYNMPQGQVPPGGPNPHRLFGRGSYRPRQPGIGYQ